VTTNEYPPMEGWLTIPEVAKTLGVTRQRAHQIIKSGGIKGARTIGENAVIVVPEDAVKAYRDPEPGNLPG
jgi:excisionase family DNA binding protein